MANWFFGRDGQKVGPFSANQIQQLATLGMIKPSDHLLEEGAKQWVAVLSLPWLSFIWGSKKYYINIFNKTHGPFSTEQLRAALICGNIPPETPACQQNAKDWHPLSQLTEFQNALPTTTVKEPESPSRVGGAEMTREEAELYLAGKRGDTIAKLVATLQELRNRFSDNPTMQGIIGKNIQDLLEIRQKGKIINV